MAFSVLKKHFPARHDLAAHHNAEFDLSWRQRSVPNTKAYIVSTNTPFDNTILENSTGVKEKGVPHVMKSQLYQSNT